MISKKNFLISGKTKKPIVTDLFYNQSHVKKPLVIFCHGYKGYKDWGAFNLMTSYFLEAGFAFLKFNFSHNGGTPEQPIDFPDLEAFGHNNYTIELNDLDSVINWVTSQSDLKSNIDFSKIYLIGHSRGGAIVTLKTAEDSRIKKIVTWASVSTLFRTMFHEGKELEKWKKDGVMHIINGRTRQKMPHYIQFYENYMSNQEKLNVEKAAKSISVPHLIIHGDTDDAVPLKHGEQLYKWNSKSEFVTVSNSNHVFGAHQPWTSKELPSDLKIVIEKTISFLRKT